MDLPPSVFPSLIMDMDIQLPTAMVMTLPMVMAREMPRLSQDMVVMLPATPTDLHRVSLDIEVTVMEDTEDMVTTAREMLRLSQEARLGRHRMDMGTPCSQIRQMSFAVQVV